MLLAYSPSYSQSCSQYTFRILSVVLSVVLSVILSVILSVYPQSYPSFLAFIYRLPDFLSSSSFLPSSSFYRARSRKICLVAPRILLPLRNPATWTARAARLPRWWSVSRHCFKRRKHINNLKNKVFKISPTDFTIHLPETITNVIELQVCSLNLPHPFYNISPYYKNNYIKIEDCSGCLELELPSGYYKIEEIICILNKSIKNNPFFKRRKKI